MIIMVILTLALVLALAFVALRLFLLHGSIRELTGDFREIVNMPEGSRHVQIAAPDRELEALAAEMNRYIERCLKEDLAHRSREREIREEITNISHDLRTPLTSVAGYLGLLEDPGLSQEEREAYFAIVRRRSRDLEDRIQSLYDYARLEGLEFRLELSPVNIRKELCDCLLSFYDEFEREKIRLAVDLPEEEVWVRADAGGLNRAFYNLLTNLLKYHGGEGKIWMRTEAERVLICFENPAPGLSAEEAGKLFGRFYQGGANRLPGRFCQSGMSRLRGQSREADMGCPVGQAPEARTEHCAGQGRRSAPAPRGSGTGLGLTVTKLLVEQMGGEITAEAEEGWLRIRMEFGVSS